jgi:hypothetical protein
VEDGERRMKDGGCRAEVGEWEEGGGCSVEGGGIRMKDGGCREKVEGEGGGEGRRDEDEEWRAGRRMKVGG